MQKQFDELVKVVQECAAYYPEGFFRWVKTNKPSIEARLNRLEKEVNRAFGTEAFASALGEWRVALMGSFTAYNKEKVNAAG